jgi:hypothetical protein
MASAATATATPRALEPIATPKTLVSSHNTTHFSTEKFADAPISSASKKSITHEFVFYATTCSVSNSDPGFFQMYKLLHCWYAFCLEYL